MPSTGLHSWKICSVCTRMGLLSRRRNCLLVEEPMRLPAPPARTIAKVLILPHMLFVVVVFGKIESFLRLLLELAKNHPAGSRLQKAGHHHIYRFPYQLF